MNDKKAIEETVKEELANMTEVEFRIRKQIHLAQKNLSGGEVVNMELVSDLRSLYDNLAQLQAAKVKAYKILSEIWD